MEKKRRIPKNPKCPLKKQERAKICKLLDDMEWKYYLPYKHLTSGYADARVVEYDEIEIRIEIKHGLDTSGLHYIDDEIIERANL